MSPYTANYERIFDIDDVWAMVRAREAEIAALEAQVARLRDRLLEWHSTHGWSDNRSRADSFADCEHVICVAARAALEEKP